MKYTIIFSLILIACLGCEQKKYVLKGQTPFQQKLNAEYKDVTTSPLKPKDFKNFKGLDFFNFDSTYVVRGILKRTPESQWFNMRTTTSRVSKERVFGMVSFTLLGASHTLELYQGEDMMTKAGFDDYLFLPFLDETNGIETYGGGRYIDARIPKGDTLIIDFNTAYNPYCAYNSNYSCPVVPRANYLKVKIKAGVKAFRISEAE